MTIKSTIGIVSPYGNTNYVLNSSGETTGNFSLQGSATVTRVTTYQKYGLYSYQIAITASGGGINLTLSSLPNAPHYVSFRVKKPEAVKLNVTIGSATKEARFLEKLDAEWSLFWATFSAAESSGQTNLRITQLGAGTNTIYLDGAQVEPNKLTTYIDGTQEGARWNGTAHGSTSTRSADSRAGGVVEDFWQGYGFFPEKVLGAGAVVEDLNIDSYAFLPGGELNSSKIRPREFTIIGFFLGNSKEDLHAKAQALELELGLDTYPGRQPVRIRYFGATVQKEIAARYTGGLEGELPIFYNDDSSVEDEKWMRHYKFKMKASVQFIATDPFWYEVGESATLLDTNDTATFRVVAARLESTGQWSPLGPPGAGGSYGAVRALAEDDTYLYIASSSTNFDGIADADRIVRYNKATGVYTALSTGANNDINALAIGPTGILYAGGSFTSIGGVVTNAIAYWDGAAWNAMGSANSTVHALFFGPDGLLYAGGDFTVIGGVGANRVASWNGSAWSALSTGSGSSVRALTFIGSNLIAAGGFDFGSGVVDGVASWDGSTWTPLGTTGMNDIILALAVASNGTLFAGGSFTTVDGLTVNYIAQWNGSVWSGLGGGVSDGVTDLAMGADGTLYLGGVFTTAGGLTLPDRIATWNGYTYGHLDIDLPGSPTTIALLASKYADPVVKQKYTLWVGFSTTGTGAYAGAATSSNDGTISAFPKIIFSRSGGTTATLQALRNERTGRKLLFDYALLSGETLTIDLNPKNRTITSSFFGSRPDAILANSDFSTWQLLPGNNQVTAFISESGSPTVTGYILYRTPFRSWN